MSLTEVIFWLVFVGGVVGAIFSPICGILLYIIIYNVRPEVQWWGINVAHSGIPTSFTVALATVIGMVLHWRPMRKGEQQFPLMFKLMIMMLLYAFLISMSDQYLLGTAINQRYLIKMVKIYLFIFMMIRIVRTATQFRWMLWAWLTGTIYIGYEAWSGVGVTVSGRLTGGLGGPDFTHSSGLSAHLVPMIAIAGFLYYSSESKRGKFFALLAAAFAVNTIILTRTRNAFPGVLVLIVFGLLRLPRGMRLKCAVGVVVGMGLALQLTDSGWWSRMETLKNPNQDPSVLSRYEYWRAAVEMAKDHPFGVSPGHFKFMVPQYVHELQSYRSVHSTYFQCLSELGYPGTLLFFAILGAALWQFEKARSAGRDWKERIDKDPQLAIEQRNILLMATANEVAIAGFLVSSMFTSRLWAEGFWLLLATSCCALNISRDLQERVHASRQPAPSKSNSPMSSAAAVVGV